MDNVKGNMKVLLIAILFLGSVSSGCGPLNEVVFTPLPSKTFTPIRTIQPANTLLPTYTQTPTDTPIPTGTVTPTLIPGALDCNMINSNHFEGITDYQWAEYIKTVIGKQSYFSGGVFNVNVDGVVELSATNPQCIYLLSNIPLERVIKINKDQYMEGYGAISAIKYNDGAIIYINVLMDSLIIR